MPKDVKSRSAPHSIRKILDPRKRGGSYEFLSKPIADVVERPPTERDERIRAIGLRAYRLGGKSFMLEVFWRLDRQGTKVGCRWDGIGGWYR